MTSSRAKKRALTALGAGAACVAAACLLVVAARAGVLLPAVAAVAFAGVAAWVAGGRARRRHLPGERARLLPPRPSGRCPTCGAPLAAAAGAHAARACPRGHGALVPAPASERLLERAGGSADVVRAGGSRETPGPVWRKRVPCPACAAEMRVALADRVGLGLDMCPGCGALWLDAPVWRELSVDGALLPGP